MKSIAYNTKNQYMVHLLFIPSLLYSVVNHQDRKRPFHTCFFGFVPPTKNRKINKENQERKVFSVFPPKVY